MSDSVSIKFENTTQCRSAKGWIDLSDRVEAYQDEVEALKADLWVAVKALENIQTVTFKPNQDFKSLVSGATKMGDFELIDHAKDVDALGSLVYGFADKALAILAKWSKR